MQQPQRVVEHVREDGARDFTVGFRSTDPRLRALEIPIRELVPDKAARRFGILAESKARVPLFDPPFSFLWSRWTERRVAFQDRRVEST